MQTIESEVGSDYLKWDWSGEEFEKRLYGDENESKMILGRKAEIVFNVIPPRRLMKLSFSLVDESNSQIWNLIINQQLSRLTY